MPSYETDSRLMRANRAAPEREVDYPLAVVRTLGPLRELLPGHRLDGASPIGGRHKLDAAHRVFRRYGQPQGEHSRPFDGVIHLRVDVDLFSADEEPIADHGVDLRLHRLDAHAQIEIDPLKPVCAGNSLRLALGGT